MQYFLILSRHKVWFKEQVDLKLIYFGQLGEYTTLNELPYFLLHKTHFFPPKSVRLILPKINKAWVQGGEQIPAGTKQMPYRGVPSCRREVCSRVTKPDCREGDQVPAKHKKIAIVQETREGCKRRC